MPTTWTDSSDRQLLLSIIASAAVPTPKWDLIAAKMGEGYTGKAVRQRFQKLRKMGKEGFGEGSVGDGGKEKAGEKRKGGGEEGEGGEGCAKKKAKVETAEEGDEEDEF